MAASKTAVAEYMKIRRYVLNLINKAGNEPVQLPTALELAKRFGVCRQTVGKTLKQLAEENYVIGKPGLGTFTNPKRQFRYSSRRERLTVGIIVGDGMVIEMDKYIAQTVAACLVEVSLYPAYVRIINLATTKPDVILKELKNEFLDALIWQNPPPNFLPLLEEIKKSGIATVIISDSCRLNAISGVEFDRRKLGYECGKRLLKAGKTQVLFLRDDRPWNVLADGLRQAFQEAKVPLNDKLFLKGHDALEKLKMIFELGVPVEVIVNTMFSYEELADIARQTDFDLGRQIHICWDLAAEQIPDFHGFCYSHDFTALAKVTVGLLREQLEKADSPARNVLVPLQIREVPFD